MIQGINATALRKLVGTNDAGKDSQQAAYEPPSKWVTEEVDLLLCVVVGPEADTTKKEGPLDWETGVGVAAGQSVVVVEHGALQLKVLLQERYVLDLLDLLDETGAVGGNTGNLLDKPDVAGLLDVLVAVDLGLLESPVWQRSGVSPHGDLGRVVNELEVRRHALKVLASLCTLNPDLPEGFVETSALCVVGSNGGEFLVGGVVW